LDESRDFIVALYRSLFPTQTISRRSYHGRRATYLAGAVTQLHFHVDSVQKDLHPKTAGDGKPINDWGDVVGVERKGATGARKAAAGRVRGAAGETALSGEALVHDASGLAYELTENATIPGVLGVDPDSFVDVGIAATDTGSQTRLEAGDTLRFVSTPAGIQTNVVLQLDLDEDGFDAEQFGSYRSRVLSTFSDTPAGGNQNDFVNWTLASLASVRTAFAYPNRGGRGTIDVVGFYAATGTARALTLDDRNAVKAYIQTQAPFQVTGDGGGLRVLETIASPQPVEILLTANGIAEFAFNWDDSGAPTVLAWNGTTRELQFSGGALPASLRAGHSLVLRGVGSAQDGAELKIESISGVDKVILEVVPPVAPAATDVIYSGGPLVTPVRNAVLAHLNGEIVYAGRGLTPLPESAVESAVGLDVLAEGLGPSNPGGLYGSWSGAIVLATLFGIAKYKAGVRDVTIVTPASNLDAENDGFPNDDQIHYITPAAVLIRRG
jgi:uncharacterized phage protein gp47/JayE